MKPKDTKPYVPAQVEPLTPERIEEIVREMRDAYDRAKERMVSLERFTEKDYQTIVR